ncbi:transport protein particle complex subunit [Scheffersomyces xylosifermentans]|uniref:transport protein particle complex subunit n=1 Tax=Scheffersomyces xylosifermentans TaxID=1304137 RepID=UPI00315CE5C2
MSNEDIILPSASSLSTLSISDISRTGFGYNPSVGPASNSITPETSNILLNRKTITLTPTSANSIYDKNINSKKINEISLSSLSFLFCEIVNWSHKNSKGIQDLETRLNGLGYQIGQRFLELNKLREGFKTSKREIRIIEVLQFIHGTFWKSIFGKVANELEKSQDVTNEYMIIDNVPLISKFISIPKDYGNLNCAAFMAGIIEGALDSASFHADVTAHSVPLDGFPLRTVFLIKFDESLMIRESLRFS